MSCSNTYTYQRTHTRSSFKSVDIKINSWWHLVLSKQNRIEEGQASIFWFISDILLLFGHLTNTYLVQHDYQRCCYCCCCYSLYGYSLVLLLLLQAGWAWQTWSYYRPVTFCCSWRLMFWCFCCGGWPRIPHPSHHSNVTPSVVQLRWLHLFQNT